VTRTALVCNGSRSLSRITAQAVVRGFVDTADRYQRPLTFSKAALLAWGISLATGGSAPEAQENPSPRKSATDKRLFWVKFGHCQGPHPSLLDPRIREFRPLLSAAMIAATSSRPAIASRRSPCHRSLTAMIGETVRQALHLRDEQRPDTEFRHRIGCIY
jgi:hypothetical protein